MRGQHQSLNFERISVEQGLSNGNVYCVLQDRRGYLWVGTGDGLNRYDGYSFVTYRHNPRDSFSLADNQILTLKEDRSGIIWIGTKRGGLHSFDWRTGKFHNFRHDPRNPKSLGDDLVDAIYEDRQGVLWIGTDHSGLERFNREQNAFTHFVHDSSDSNSISGNMVLSILEDKDKGLWVGTAGAGLDWFDQSKGVFRHFRHNPADNASLPNDFIWSLRFDQSGTLWIGTGRGLSKFERSTYKFTTFLKNLTGHSILSNNTIKDLLFDRWGGMWVGTWNGGINFSRRVVSNPVFEHYGNKADTTSSAERTIFPNVITLYEDLSGNVWIGTGNGLYKASRNRYRFQHYSHEPGNINSLSSNIVVSLLLDRSGSLWIQTLRGLDRFERDRNIFTVYRRDPRNSKRNIINFDGGSLYEDRSGVLWIGNNNGLSEFNRATGNVVNYRYKSDPGGSGVVNQVNSVLEDRIGNFWVATSAGLYLFDRQKHNFTLLPSFASSSMVGFYLWGLFEDSRRNLWLGSWGAGVYRFPSTLDTVIQYRHDPSNRSSISDNRVMKIIEDHSGTIWLATFGGGLDRFDEESQRFSSYTEEQGLINNDVEDLTEDSHGRLWIATHRGLSRFDPRKETFKNYTVDDGLPSARYLRCCKTPKGELIFSCFDNGFIIFHPDSLPENESKPGIVITQFKKFDRPVAFDRPFSELREIELQYKEDFFSFEFAALDYTAPQRNRYAYKLEGFDREWIQSGTRHYASYTNLDPGEYVFRVKGSNSDGIWNEEGASITIMILPPFWRTWWFFLAVSVVLISGMTLLYRYRIAKLLEMERLRLRIASDLHDDFGSSLSGIALMSDQLRSQLRGSNQENRELSVISSTARQMANALRDTVWLINPEYDKLDNILLRMKDAAAALLPGVSYTLQFPERALSGSLSMVFRRNLLMVYKEILHNIVKHAHAKHVDIMVEERHGRFRLLVRDDGIGFDQSNVSLGNGLRNLRSRAEQLGGRIEFSTAPGKGTEVLMTVRIP
jgi:ligand-binding sensor domain-containing protein/signal transduction histidine kinase